MSEQQWSAVDDYLTRVLVQPDAALQSAVESSARAGLPAIQVAPNQGKLLLLLARLQGARRVLEIGTLGGYSTIWLARGLPDGGKVLTLEAEPRHAQVALENLERAGVADRVDVRVGRALDTLPQVAQETYEPFDLVFIDADKANIPQYLQWALKLTRPGSLIVIDNVIREGAVIDPAIDDPDVRGVRELNDMLASEPRLVATALQTVGSKGYDGLALALVVEPPSGS